jgi:hypothetical protein
MMAGELNINKETIQKILHEDLRKRQICAKFVPQRFTDEQKQRRLTSYDDFIQTCQDNSNFTDCHVLSPKAKTALYGKRFQDDENRKKNVTAELNTVPFEAFGNCFQKLFKRFSTCIHAFKWAEIAFSRNKTIFYFIVFFIFLSHQARNFISRPRMFYFYSAVKVWISCIIDSARTLQNILQ